MQSSSRAVVGPQGTVWCIAALSGMAGLGYEMVWTRALGVALGTEMGAVLGVIAGLFAGLAVGGWCLDRTVARTRHPGLLYAALELVIALWGSVCAVALPRLAVWLPPWLGTHPSPPVAALTCFAVPAIVLLPATAAMGGTLAALARMLEQVPRSRRAPAAAYAANTMGAVAGTGLTVYVLFPGVGLTGTLACLVLLNLAAARLAVWHHRRADGLVSSPPATEAGLPPARTTSRRALLTLGLTGFLGIGVEVLVVRAAAQFLSDTIYTFAGLLLAYLFGSSLGGALRRGWREPVGDRSLILLLCLASLLVGATLGGLPAIAQWVQVRAVTDPVGEALVSVVMFLPSAIAMGALYADRLEAHRGEFGTVGRACAVNALGAAIAPAVVALVLIPLIGTMATLWAVAGGYLLLLPPRRLSFAVALVPMAALVGLALDRPALPISLPVHGREVASMEGAMVAASVVDDAQGNRYLEVNGHLRMGGTSSQRSDYRQALLPVLLHPRPRRALFLGVGTGATLAGAMRYPGLAVQGLEISEEVVGLLPYFAVPDQPNPLPNVLVADARRYLAADTQVYDLIVADNFHPALEGSGSLYTREHFAAVRAHLGAGGLFCQWLPLYQLDPASLRDIVRTYLEAFPDASGWLAHFSVQMPMLALCGSADGAAPNLASLPARLSDPRVHALLERLDLDDPLAVAGTFLADAAVLRRYAGPGRVNSDDRPVVALNGAANVVALGTPVQQRLIDLVRATRDRAFRWPMEGIAADRVRRYLAARDTFLEAGASMPGNPRGRALIDAAVPGLLAAVGQSAEFDPAYRPLLGMAAALAGSDPAAARTLLQRIDAAAPTRREAREALGAAVAVR